MPEIDTELFQWLVLGLLVLIVLIALIVTSMISKLTKQAPAATAPPSSDEPVERAPVESATSAIPASETAAGSRSSWEPTYTSDVGTLTGGEPAASSPTPEPAATPAEEPAPTAAAEPIPEEEPFERDGRWWFKRGDELLVYDEGSGQWQPAPAGSFPQAAAAAPPASSSAYSGSTAAEPAGGASTAPAEAAATGGGEAEGGFWKCPSCGAINGATAASCRMCFTARP